MSHAHGGSKEEENEPVAVPASWLPERFRLPRELMLMIGDVAKGLCLDPDTAGARVRLDGRAVGEPSKKPEDVCTICRKQT
jgi:hypothetical protein